MTTSPLATLFFIALVIVAWELVKALVFDAD